ncbi:hypothetical protein Cantr_00748 [Candida viswanathii]|uniref:Uncharacterized protein n=1 Tax=Candida viswanathii TaxID=5486 RepID=A0A367YGJ1_9ASCO|nr:hypothetical protein Cantr_00748 [Candida viswanathii]
MDTTKSQSTPTIQRRTDSNITMASLCYIIPPYLLETSKGSQLQKELAKKNEQMSLLNVVTTDSPYYYNHAKHQESLKTNKFSKDPYLNQIIKDKVIYKLAILGVLGSNPMEMTADNEDYLYLMFNTFKHRFINDTNEKSAKPNLEHESLSESANKLEPSMFLDPKVGEIDVSKLSDGKNLPAEYKKYLHLTLKELILLTDYHKYKYPPSFIDFGKESYFEYPLPISWVPLIPNPYLDYLERKLNLEINNDQGYSSIGLSTGKNPKPNNEFENVDDLVKARYYNFISDKPITSSCGIFYYELEVEQAATDATNFRPITMMNDSSISTNCSLNMAAGFTKRLINFDPSSNNQSLLSLGEVDLEKVKSDIFYNSSSPAGSDTKMFLSSRPGEFPGSVAINFEDSTFYNSIKGSDSIQRTQILNMNRRLNNRTSNDTETGKVDIGIPFKTKLIEDTDTKRVHKTDTIGCGVNFIDKSVFITLNGVLARVLPEEDLNSTDATTDDLFGKEIKDIYPIIGFKVNELETFDATEPTTFKIRSNFGFKSFVFNIQDYVDYFKNQQKKLIDMKLLEIKDDPLVSNELIKRYLIKHGFLETQKSFEKELPDQVVANMPDVSLETIVEGVQHNMNKLAEKDSEFLLASSTIQ